MKFTRHIAAAVIGLLLLLCPGARAAVTYVNSSVLHGGAGNSTTAVTATFATTTGNILICGIQQNTNQTPPTSVVNAASQAFTHFTAADVGYAGTLIQTVWYLFNITGNASDAITATWAGNENFFGIVCRQYNPNGLTFAADVAAKTTSLVAGQTSGTTPAFTTTGANDIIVVFAVTANSGTAGGGPIGGVTATNAVGDAGAGAQRMESEDLITTNPQVGITANILFGVTTASSQTSVVSFKAIAGGSTDF